MHYYVFPAFCFYLAKMFLSTSTTTVDTYAAKVLYPKQGFQRLSDRDVYTVLKLVMLHKLSRSGSERHVRRLYATQIERTPTHLETGNTN